MLTTDILLRRKANHANWVWSFTLVGVKKSILETLYHLKCTVVQDETYILRAPGVGQSTFIVGNFHGYQNFKTLKVLFQKSKHIKVFCHLIFIPLALSKRL